MTREQRLEAALEGILENVKGLSRQIQPITNEQAKWYFRIIEQVAGNALKKDTTDGQR
jgi:hypothetical protein